MPGVMNIARFNIMGVELTGCITNLERTSHWASAAQQLSPGQLSELKQEMAMLREFHALAKSIIKNSKGEVLLTALRRGFAAAEQAQKS